MPLIIQVWQLLTISPEAISKLYMCDNQTTRVVEILASKYDEIAVVPAAISSKERAVPL